MYIKWEQNVMQSIPGTTQKVNENHPTYFHSGPSGTDRMTSDRKTLKIAQDDWKNLDDKIHK